jgi:hypothetical protein
LLSKDFEFQGGLAGRKSKLYKERSAEWPMFGTGKGRQTPNANDAKDCDLSPLNKNILKQHQQKCMISCGLFDAFYRMGKHAYLMLENVIEGVFEKGQPLAGLPFIEFDKILDKGHQLTITNPIKRSTHNKMRLPVCINDMACPGGTLKQYLAKVSLGQQRFYCHKASVAQNKLYFK